VIKLESLYVLHLSVHIMAVHWEVLKKCFFVASSDFLVQYFVPFITTYLESGKIFDT